MASVTGKCNMIADIVCSPVFVDKCIRGNKVRQNEEERNKFLAFWDTGANMSGISPKVVQRLNLQVFGSNHIYGVNGSQQKDSYLISLGLMQNNSMLITELEVTCIDCGGDTDVLIGMDVMSLGDFALTNLNRQTWFTFRVPSLQHIDFQISRIKDDSACSCGSGKQYRNCCKKLVVV